MKDSLPEINKRVKLIIDAQAGGVVSQFADTIGFSQQRLNRLFIKDTRTGKFPTVPIEIVIKITEMFVNISPDWLLNNKGEMYRGENVDNKHLFGSYYKTKNSKKVINNNDNLNDNLLAQEPKQQKKLSILNEPEAPYNLRSYTLRTDKTTENQIIPIYNIEASAGLLKLLDSPLSQTVIDYISIPNLPNCDGALYVTGDSMYPILKSGDIVAYKQIHDIQNDIFYGEMYILSIDMSGEELVTIKYVQKSEHEGYIKLVSQNKHHSDKDVLITRVRALALIKASIRYNMMY